MKDYLRTLAAGLSLILMIRPPAHWRVRPAAHFWWLFPLSVMVTIWRDWLVTSAPAVFYADGLQSDALGSLLILAMATTVGALSGRRVLSFSIAVLASAASLWISFVGAALEWLSSQSAMLAALPESSLFILLVGWWLLALRRVLDTVLPDWHWSKRGLCAIAGAALTVAPFLALDPARYWYQDYSVADAPSPDAPAAPSRSAPGSAERLMYLQPDLVDAAVARMRPGVPGQVDAYLLGFGGDAGEDVFRNEVEYAERLFAQRFGLAGRTLTLLNHPETTQETPLASRSNLERALKGMAAKMNADEDLLILFLTSHGSADHQLYVALDPLPLDAITPVMLREALDAAQISWRVVVVSACYSGGFVETLATPMSLVLTAASADRTSFGCGSDSSITYFGQAFLVEALNQTTSLVGAFEIAREAIAQRERDEDFKASEPQMAMGALIGSRLASWQKGLQPGPVVRFEPGNISPTCAAGKADCAGRP